MLKINKGLGLFLMSGLLFFGGCSDAEKPENMLPPIVLDGVDKTIPADGNLVTIKVVNHNKLPGIFKNVKYDWKLYDGNQEKDIHVSEDGKSIYFGAGISPKRYVLAVDAIYTMNGFGEKTKTTGITTREVVVGDAPAPNPGPSPIPIPNVPDGYLGFTKLSFDTAISKVPPARRVEVAKALADNYSGISSKISAGVYANLDDVFKDLKSLNTSTLNKLGVTPTDWANWNQTIAHELFTNYSNKKLSVLSDYKLCFDAISDGLKAVK